MYGPTETTIWSAASPVAPGPGAVTIGPPIANTEFYVLDKHGQPVPIGVAGELHIGGEGVARSYWNQPRLTAEKFIADPFRGDPASRLYKTGDLVRCRPDGTLEFLGRLDTQVKVHGFRIETSEVEYVLKQYPGVHECVVTAREDSPGDKRLVAYLVAPAAPAAGELRRFLSAKLPSYMVPSAFVPLDALPHTPNGKIDRKALPRPDANGTGRNHDAVAPRNPREQTLADICADVLKVEGIAVHDSLFDLGADSLQVFQIVARAMDAGLKVTPKQVLSERTIAAICESHRPDGTRGRASRRASACRRLTGSVSRAAIPAARIGRSEWIGIVPMIAHQKKHPDRQDAGGADPWADDVFVFPTSVGQHGFWYLDQFQPGNPAYNIAVRFRLQGRLRAEELERALNEIVRRHESLRTVFAVVDGVPVQVVSPRLSIRLQRDDLRGGPEKDRRQRAGAVAAEEAHLPFDLTKGPLIRARLLRLDDEEHTLLVTIHHIVSDGWSIGVLTKELGALYDAYCRGLDSPLPELALQCGDFAVWQEQWLQSQA